MVSVKLGEIYMRSARVLLIMRMGQLKSRAVAAALFQVVLAVLNKVLIILSFSFLLQKTSDNQIDLGNNII